MYDMLLKTMQFSNSTLQFRSKMQSFTICTKLMIKTQKTKIPSNAKCLFFFCIFNISKPKMHGLKSNLIYSPTVYKKRDNSSRISSNETPSPMYQDNKNETMKRKTLPKNSTKRGFPVIPRALNRHYRDLRRLNKHQIPPNKHQTKQTGKEKACT
jgi:hypothetical protein